ncbi:hypothetical protein DPMN_051138 [Dreissena polymorpha]|uniref:Uncharacterized protein n=1 Tax=Dreissena polymorpha TaxID=45954 RepID=A0A9D4HN07_DREPO|nr:hypothetical protein DPMN_051138 [Dreissena polymorpha]
MRCSSRCPPSHSSSSNRSPQSSQSSHNVSLTYQAPPVGSTPKNGVPESPVAASTITVVDPADTRSTAHQCLGLPRL